MNGLWPTGALLNLPARRGKPGPATRSIEREPAWYYDNLAAALVAHGVAEIRPVSGYLGGSVISAWEHMEPLVAVERDRRARNALPDPNRWQEYFENLYHSGRMLRSSPSAREGGRSDFLCCKGPACCLRSSTSPQLAGPRPSGSAATMRATASSGVSVRATRSPSFHTP